VTGSGATSITTALTSKSVEEAEIHWKNVSGDSVMSKVAPDPIQKTIEAPSAMSVDTMQVWLNPYSVSVTVDSIFAISDYDDLPCVFFECALTGGSWSLIDSLATSDNGSSDRFYKKETSITAATIEAEHWICFRRPTESAGFVTFVIYISKD